MPTPDFHLILRARDLGLLPRSGERHDPLSAWVDLCRQERSEASLAQLATRWGWSKLQVQRFLGRLQREGRIRREGGVILASPDLGPAPEVTVAPPRVVTVLEEGGGAEGEVLTLGLGDPPPAAPAPPAPAPKRSRAKQATPPVPPALKQAWEQAFDAFWAERPAREGSHPRKQSQQKFIATLARHHLGGLTPALLTQALRGYTQSMQKQEKLGTPFVKQVSSFLGPEEHWRAYLGAPWNQDVVQRVSARRGPHFRDVPDDWKD